MATRIILSCFIIQTIILLMFVQCNDAAKHEHQTQCPTNTKLIKLPDGTFDCLFCSTCPPDKVERIPCTHDKDTVCSICKRGYLYDKTNKNCTQCTVCKPGWCNDTECTDDTDTVCKECPSKTTPSPHTTKETTGGPKTNGGTTEDNENGSNTNIAIVVSVSAGVLVIIIVVVCSVLVCLRRKTSSPNKSKTYHNQELETLREQESVGVKPTQALQNHIDVRYDDLNFGNNAIQKMSQPYKLQLNNSNQAIEEEQNAPLLDIRQSGNSSVTPEGVRSEIPGIDMARKGISEPYKAKLRSDNRSPQTIEAPLLDSRRQYEISSEVNITPEATKPKTYKNLEKEIVIDEKEKEDRTKPRLPEKDNSIAVDSYDNNKNIIERNAGLVNEGKRQFRDAGAALTHFTKSVGSLFYKGRVITLFRVGSVYVMTSYSAVKELLDSEEWQNSNTTMTFDDYPSSIKKTHILSRLPVITENNLDIVILKLHTDPQELPDGLSLCPDELLADLDLTFIAYGKYAIDKRQVIRNNDVIPFGSKLLKHAEEHLSDVGRQPGGSNLCQRSIDELRDESRFIWRCPVTPLNSYGSPGFVQRGNSYNVVCMYSHMIPPDIVGTAKIRDIYRFYTGPTMADVYKALKSRHPKIADEIFSV